ncbi:MAG TPA: D-Ala-D-Ala carboxypeptidase family metallohydrolase [Gemmatimonadaceae bacterium]|nr:D-Ala-D-Ala carboxypeptidase family metallohydrolase [Gemmatimonadaceae bacterium]
MGRVQAGALRKRAIQVVGAGIVLVAAAGAAPRADAARVPATSGDSIANATLIPARAPLPPKAGLWFIDSLVGRSGKLRAFFVSPSHASIGVNALQELFGDSALDRPGIYTVHDSAVSQPLSFISLVPFGAKQKGRIGTYWLGTWPHERHASRDSMYADPDGFIEVTPENEDTWVSEHFQLRDFLTHDQQDVWPKYLALDTKLIDKLELVIADLNDHGVRVNHLTIMSGFRTPEYNKRGVGARGGRARDSRHQYGDAADVFVDNNESGRMDDLNHDGRVNMRDARIIRDAVDRVEAEHPDLVGGVGLYHATHAHGPFVHIDTRGERVRWGAR